LNIRLLVADDFSPWRRFVSSLILPKMPEWHIVCEVSDGLEAVIKAQELKPDIILMDISLPGLNGIEAARQISKVASNSKILFLSAFDSHEVVEEALNAGGSGYVAKLDAASELVEAVEAVFLGKQFVSSRLKGEIAAQTEDAHASDKPAHDEAIGWRLVHSPETEFTCCHEVLFYSDDVVLLENIAHFIGAALKFGNAAIVLATKPHREMLLEELKAQGVDAGVLIQEGAYVSLEVADALSTFMVDDRPDPDRFIESFKKLIESTSKAAKANHPRVAIFVEGAALLWAEGKKEAAIQLEHLGDDLARTRKVDILCAYPFSLRIQEDKRSFEAIGAEHSAVHSK
jgi:DNA-binding NarL/FixJ family response regulator